MYPGRRRWIPALLACATLSGCLANAVHRMTAAPRHRPDAAHAYVVIGMGVDKTYPYRDFKVTLSEYSAGRQRMTGNCFRFNRIEATWPAMTAAVHYIAFEVPSNTYAFVNGFDVTLASTSSGRAFVAPPGEVVYFGDYVYVGHGAIEFRRDLESARAATLSLFSRGPALKFAEPAAIAPGALIPLCTP